MCIIIGHRRCFAWARAGIPFGGMLKNLKRCRLRGLGANLVTVFGLFCAVIAAYGQDECEFQILLREGSVVPSRSEPAHATVKTIRDHVNRVLTDRNLDTTGMTCRYTFCGPCSRNLAVRLVSRGLPMQVVAVYSTDRRGLIFRPIDGQKELPSNASAAVEHAHIRTTDGRVFIDPTWKQFFFDPEALSSESDIFIGTESDLRSLFHKYQRDLLYSGDPRDRYVKEYVAAVRGKMDPDSFIDKVYGLGSAAPLLDRKLLSDMKPRGWWDTFQVLPLDVLAAHPNYHVRLEP